jgi:sterol desaturase/sphingolipid hydroxylase (fatty acid hydroxylase superfamily)
VIDLTLYAVPAFVFLMILEAVVGTLMLQRNVHDNIRDTAASLAMGVGSVFINLAWKVVVFGYFTWLHRHAWFDLGWGPLVWVGAILADDVCYYWFHRMSHQVRFLWAAHVNHHSSERYNLSTALRQPWTTPFTSFWFWTPMPLLGFDPMMILSVQSISLLYQFWIHTELIGKMGLFEKVFNTPSHHRVHHGSNLRYLDRNHAGILIVWDKLFGTFEEEDEPVVYGLTKNIHSYNPIEIAIHEWRDLIHDMKNANDWRELFGYALQPPGWSPDGSTLTADQLRAALAVEHA